MKRRLFTWFSFLCLRVNSFVNFLRSIISRGGVPAQKVLRMWEQLSHFQRNIIIGAGVAVFISIFHHHSFISEMEDKAMDFMMYMNQSLPRMSGINAEQTRVKGYVFIDIDQETYQKWGEPYHVPRKQLLKLIQFAAGQAKIVIVDVEISKAGIDPDGDAAFIDYLRNRPETEQAELILVRNLYPGSNKVKPLFFHATGKGKKIHYGLPLFQRDKDFQIRRWFLSQDVCDNDQPTRLLSVQLLADMLAQKAGTEQLNAAAHYSLTTCTKSAGEKNTAQTHSSHSSKKGLLLYNKRTVDLSAHGIGERLIYTIPWKGISNTNHVFAGDILAAADPSSDFLKDTVVVIGASFAESRDIHATPLGNMPGALILLNAVKSMNQWGQIKTPPSWIKWLIEAILIVFMAWVYAKANSFWGTIVIGGTILIIFVPLSFWLFKAGMWVDFAIPVFGMQLHQLVAEYEEKIMLKALKKQ